MLTLFVFGIGASQALPVLEVVKQIQNVSLVHNYKQDVLDGENFYRCLETTVIFEIHGTEARLSERNAMSWQNSECEILWAANLVRRLVHFDIDYGRSPYKNAVSCCFICIKEENDEYKDKKSECLLLPSQWLLPGVVCSADAPAKSLRSGRWQDIEDSLRFVRAFALVTGHLLLLKLRALSARTATAIQTSSNVKPALKKVVLSADTLFAFDDKAVLKTLKARQCSGNSQSRMAGLNLDVVMAINGYADRIGGAAYNLKLSDRRANAVKAFLAENGVPAARIHAEGKGQADPVVDCPNPSKAGEIKTFQQLINCFAA